MASQSYENKEVRHGLANEDYTFVGQPAYTQFPDYGVTFSYTLTLPDGTSKVITPALESGDLTIDGSELSQIGSYTLTANGTGGALEPVTYTHIFGVDEPIEYLSATANGMADKVTITTISFSLSHDPTRAGLVAEDISLLNPMLIKGELTVLGSGAYSLEISGDLIKRSKEQ